MGGPHAENASLTATAAAMMMMRMVGVVVMNWPIQVHQQHVEDSFSVTNVYLLTKFVMPKELFLFAIHGCGNRTMGKK